MMNERHFQFDEAGTDLELIPLAARRLLDHIGAKLSLEGWRSLNLGDRRKLCSLGSARSVNADEARLVVRGATPVPRVIEPCGDPPGENVPEQILARAGDKSPLVTETWSRLEPMERWALLKAAQSRNSETFPRAYEEIVASGQRLTHINHQGEAHMVKVGEKAVTSRRAVATSQITFSSDAHRCLLESNAPKGDVLGTARIAAILAAKQTHQLIPLCHPVHLTQVDVTFDVGTDEHCVKVIAEVSAMDRTGVEMEALTAASVAALTIYDMLKAVDRTMVIGPTLLLEKSGGRSGSFHR